MSSEALRTLERVVVGEAKSDMALFETLLRGISLFLHPLKFLFRFLSPFFCLLALALALLKLFLQLGNLSSQEFNLLSFSRQGKMTSKGF